VGSKSVLSSLFDVVVVSREVLERERGLLFIYF